MIDVRISPPRDGTRGGQEQFSWDDVKGQQSHNRECYLGQTIKLGVVGRRGQFIKHDWYLNEKDDKDIMKDERQEEIELVQRYEDEVMQEMLGNKPHKFLLLKNRPKTEDLRKMFKESEQSDTLDNADTSQNAENIAPDTSRNDMTSRNYKSRYHSSYKNREYKWPNIEESHHERSRSYKDTRDSYRDMKGYKKSDLHLGYKGRDNHDSNREAREYRKPKSEHRKIARNSRDRSPRMRYSRHDKSKYDRHNPHENRTYGSLSERVDGKISPRRKFSQSPIMKSRD